MVDGPGQMDPVSLVARSPSLGENALTRAHLLGVIDQLADSVRSGDYTTSRGEGVLLDTAVGAVRCLLLIHQPVLSTRLSPREQQIAQMVASGGTNQAIAAALEISVWTVSTHLRRIFAKLDVGCRAEMVAHLLGERNSRSSLYPEREPIR